MSKRISQREARRLAKRVLELERRQSAQRSMWSQEYFGGVNITSVKYDSIGSVVSAIRTARALGHAVVVIADSDGTLRFMALPHKTDQG